MFKLNWLEFPSSKFSFLIAQKYNLTLIQKISANPVFKIPDKEYLDCNLACMIMPVLFFESFLPKKKDSLLWPGLAGKII